jgi:hypothetical protein
MNARRWLGRLAFSFLILAAVFLWEGKRAADRGASPKTRYGAALIFAGLGVLGIRERHRS